MDPVIYWTLTTIFIIIWVFSLFCGIIFGISILIKKTSFESLNNTEKEKGEKEND